MLLLEFKPAVATVRSAAGLKLSKLLVFIQNTYTCLFGIGLRRYPELGGDIHLDQYNPDWGRSRGFECHDRSKQSAIQNKHLCFIVLRR
jgi:hypothetical protein